MGGWRYMLRKKKNREIFYSILKTFIALTLSMLFSLLIAGLGVGKEGIIMDFLLGVLSVTILTNGYMYGLFCLRGQRNIA